jgi:hypothetical protein
MNAHIDSNPGYFDPQAEALSLGEHLGRVRGKQEGLRQGEDRGYEHGRADGRVEGYEHGIALGNEQMQLQMEFTRQYAAQNEVLTQQLETQRVLIEELQLRLDELEGGHVQLESSNTSLREALTAAHEDNEHLRAENASVTERYEERTKALAEQVWQYNHAVVFLNTVRVVLEHMVDGHSGQAKQIHDLFTRLYGEQVNRALAGGMIRTPPEKDDTFARLMPRTQRFITRMLTAGHRETQPQRGISVSSAQEPENSPLDDSRFET